MAKKSIILAIKLLVLIALLVYVGWNFPEEQWTALRQQPKNWGWLSVALAIVLASSLLSFVRWRMLVQALEVPMSLWEAIRLGFLGCLFNLVSAGSVGGDLFKAIAAVRHRKQKRVEVIGSVLVDRAIGMVGLVLVAAFSLQFLKVEPLTTELNWIRRGAWVVSMIGVGGLASVVAFGRRLPISWLTRIPYVGHGLYRLAHSGFVFAGRPGLVSTMLGISLCIHCGIAISMWWISAAFYAEVPTLAQHFLVIPPSMAAGALPLTPGGLGVQEVVVDTFFKQEFGAEAAFSGLIVATMYRLMTFVVAAIGGLYYCFGYGEVGKILKEVETK